MAIKSPNAASAIYALLRDARGPENARTLQALATLTGLSRRKVESHIQATIGEAPFVVVSNGLGYFRPTDATQIDHYIATLRARAVHNFLRSRRVLNTARREGWSVIGRKTANPKGAQPSLKNI